MRHYILRRRCAMTAETIQGCLVRDEFGGLSPDFSRLKVFVDIEVVDESSFGIRLYARRTLLRAKGCKDPAFSDIRPYFTSDRAVATQRKQNRIRCGLSIILTQLTF